MSEDATTEVAKKPANGVLSRMGKGLTYKNGKFSKTAMFASLANVLVLSSYVLSFGAGATVVVGTALSFTLPAFDTSAALGLLTVINGTYIGNNLLKGLPAGD